MQQSRTVCCPSGIIFAPPLSSHSFFMATNSGVSATTRGLVGVWVRMQQYSVNKSTTGRPKGGRHLYCTHDCLRILITMMLTCCVGYLPSWKGVEGVVSNRYLISVSSVWTVCLCTGLLIWNHHACIGLCV